MERRYFEYLYNEICVALNCRVSRYDLWLLVWNSGGDPDELSRDQVRLFLERGLDPLLSEEGAALLPRARRRLERRLIAFEPDHPTPEEWAAGLGGQPTSRTL
jgi:hypothetical protein